jgi:putative transposase
VIKIVADTKKRSGWTVSRTVSALGLPCSVFYAWRARANLKDRSGSPCRAYELLPEERTAICDYAKQHPTIGYRKLTWMMIDENVASVGESSVYRVLDAADLRSPWKRSIASDGTYNFRPDAPNDQWHTDVMYIWVANRFYFLLNFIDAYSRYSVHHKLLITLDGSSVSTELQAALEANPEAKPRIVHDHGSEFTNREVAKVIKQHNLIEIKTRPRHPESNGIVERFNGTVRAESHDEYGANYLQAVATVAKLMDEYNHKRLHASLGYMTPLTWHQGKQKKVNEERIRRIAAARAHRKTINQQRMKQAA